MPNLGIQDQKSLSQLWWFVSSCDRLSFDPKMATSKHDLEAGLKRQHSADWGLTRQFKIFRLNIHTTQTHFLANTSDPRLTRQSVFLVTSLLRFIHRPLQTLKATVKKCQKYSKVENIEICWVNNGSREWSQIPKQWQGIIDVRS